MSLPRSFVITPSCHPPSLNACDRSMWDGWAYRQHHRQGRGRRGERRWWMEVEYEQGLCFRACARARVCGVSVCVRALVVSACTAGASGAGEHTSPSLLSTHLHLPPQDGVKLRRHVALFSRQQPLDPFHLRCCGGGCCGCCGGVGRFLSFRGFCGLRGRRRHSCWVCHCCWCGHSCRCDYSCRGLSLF